MAVQTPNGVEFSPAAKAMAYRDDLMLAAETFTS
jgi:hypothetical protein